MPSSGPTLAEIAAAARKATAKLPTPPALAHSVGRVYFNASLRERQYAGPIKAWMKQHNIGGKLAIGNKTIQQLKRELGPERLGGSGPYDFAVISNPVTFKELGLQQPKAVQDDWRGSMIETPALPCPVLVTNPLWNLHKVPTFRWTLEKDLAKLLSYNRGGFRYSYRICTGADDVEAMLNAVKSAYIVVADIETSRHNFITSIAFTLVHNPAAIGQTFVLDWTKASQFDLFYAATKAVLADPATIKCFHNGTFDCFQLFRHRIPVVNYLLDTEYLWHCWEAETQKSLASVASFLLPDFKFWKHEAADNPLEYNAKDTINTARVLLTIMAQAPDWVWKNYAKIVPKLTPTIMMNLEGFATDSPLLSSIVVEQSEAIEAQLAALRAAVGSSKFNPNSPAHLSWLFYDVLGAPAPTGKKKKASTKISRRTTAVPKTERIESKAPQYSTDAKALAKIELYSPLCARFVAMVKRYRKASKAMSTYYKAKLSLSGRLYYTYSVDGTTTGRYSCSQSMIYAPIPADEEKALKKNEINLGTQIQNAPGYYKKVLMADEGYVLRNIDKSKSEAECVALISGDETFAAAIKDKSRDFYLALAEIFFGLVTTDKSHPIRQVTKKINHGSSYCMGVLTFIENVGVAAIYKYMELVGWQGKKDPMIFVDYLLKTLYLGRFPGIKRWWYRTTRELIDNAGLLTTIDGSVRHFFQVPNNVTGISPAAVAHHPQRLSVVALDRAMCRIFYEIQLETGFALRLKGQVHDSVVYQVLEERDEELTVRAKEILEAPYLTTKGPLQIPVDVSPATTHWKEPT